MLILGETDEVIGSDVIEVTEIEMQENDGPETILLKEELAYVFWPPLVFCII